MGSEPLLDALLNTLREAVRCRLSVGEDDKGFDDFAAQRIGTADDRCLGDGFVLDQAVFDLARPDAVSGAGDDVVLASDEPQIAVCVAVA